MLELAREMRRLAEKHPHLTAWIGLALGMVLILLMMSRGVELLPTQMAVLIVSTVLLAGACVWIISWESDDQTSP